MKRIIFTLILISFGLISAEAQNVFPFKTYRVTAYKAGDRRIFSVSNYAEVKAPQRYYIPSAFTPNGDGYNDTFGIKGESIEAFHMIIFNRFGEAIFESENPSIQWDGKHNGEAVQEGVYTYTLYALGNESIPKTGSVTLLR